MNCGNEMKMKKRSSQWTQFMQLRKEAWKNSGLQRGLNPWPRDTGAMLYQLSYEATDVGSRSIVGSYVPVKEMSVNDIWNTSYVNCGNEMKVKKWMASFRNCINCVHCDDHFFISFPQFIFALNSSGRWSRKIRRFCRGRHLRPGQMIWEEKKFWHTSGVVKSFYLKETE